MNETEQMAAVKQIQENRAIPLRRISLSQTVFEIREGHNRWWVIYHRRKKTVVEVPELEARYKPKDKVRWTEGTQVLRGKIAVVVPINSRLTEKLDIFRKAGYDTSLIETSDRARHQVSYLVAIGKLLHWPLTSKLRYENSK